jgi:hypothetical protein
MESPPQRSCPYGDRDTKETQGDSGNNFGKEPNFLLHGCELEFSVARHGKNTAYDGSIASCEDQYIFLGRQSISLVEDERKGGLLQQESHALASMLQLPSS